MEKLKIVFISILFSFACQPAKQIQPLDVTELTIAEIHSAYQKGDFNSVQLVTAYLDRIHQWDTLIHAITTINPQALSIAKELDEEYQRTKVLRPLHGIPILVKDNIQTKGLLTTAGAIALKDFVPEEDAFIMDKLVKAGAIVIAKSNMAEWAFTPWSSISSTHGATLNPYNMNYTPAGSSGGTGASVAANFGTIGLGTDTGNSIRGPSSHNALVGFRTTLGLISRSGIVPLYLRNDVVGPMCRTVEDATRVLEVMAGYDVLDPITKHSSGKIPDNYTQFLQKDGLKGARIGVLRELSEADPDPEIKELFEKAITDMKSLGAVIMDSVEIPDFSNLRKNQWCNEFKTDIEFYLVNNVKNDSIKSLDDIIHIGTKLDFVRERIAGASAKQGRYENPEIPCGDAYTDQRRIAFRKAIEDMMDALNLDAIVYPSWNNKPAKITAYREDYKGDNSQIISPHTGQPAFTVPMGFTEGNLPAGIQFLGRMYDEPALIKLTYSYEQGTRHRVPPTMNK